LCYFLDLNQASYYDFLDHYQEDYAYEVAPLDHCSCLNVHVVVDDAGVADVVGAADVVDAVDAVDVVDVAVVLMPVVVVVVAVADDVEFVVDEEVVEVLKDCTLDLHSLVSPLALNSLESLDHHLDL